MENKLEENAQQSIQRIHELQLEKEHLEKQIEVRASYIWTEQQWKKITYNFFYKKLKKQKK